MKVPVTAALAVCFIAALAACSPEASQAQGGRGVASQERKVDWAQAQKEQPSANAVTTANSGFDVQVANAADDSPVPMLAPPATAAVASGLDDEATVVRVTPDGYFATFAGPKYDVTVHGTKAFYVAPNSAPAKTQDAEPALRFEQGEGQAQITFKRYGADYLIEFNCKTGAADQACITEAEAAAFARRLQLVSQ